MLSSVSAEVGLCSCWDWDTGSPPGLLEPTLILF